MSSMFVVKFTKYISKYRLQCSIWTSKSNEKLEDTNRKIRSRKSKDRQSNDQDKKDKKTNNDLQNTSQKTKD